MRFGSKLTKANSSPQQSTPVSVTPTDYEAIAEKLIDSASTTATAIKAQIATYALPWIGAVVSVARITDEQLLAQTALKLPVIDIEIPLVPYFAFLPLLVVIFHLSILIQLTLLSHKLNDLSRCLAHVPQEHASISQFQLENFMLSHALVHGRRALLHNAAMFLTNCVLVVAPLATLLLIQVQFLPYHSESMMWWHRMLLLFDALALLYFWPSLFGRKESNTGAWFKLMILRVMPRVLALSAVLLMFYVASTQFYLPLATILIILGFVIAGCLILSTHVRTLARLEESSAATSRQWLKAVRWYEATCCYLTLFVIATSALILLTWTVMEWLSFQPPGRGLLVTTSAIALGLVALTVGFMTRQVRTGSGSNGIIWLSHGITKRFWAARRYDAPTMTVVGIECLSGLVVSLFVLGVPSTNEHTIILSNVCQRLVYATETVELDDSSFWNWLLVPTIPTDAAVKSEIAVVVPSVTVATCADTWAQWLGGDSANGLAPVSAVLLGAFGERRVLVLDEKVLTGQELSPEQREKLRLGDGVAIGGIEPIVLRDRDLSGIQLNNATLPRAKVSQTTNLERASMVSAQLQGASLRSAQLSDARLVGAQLQGAQLSGAQLQRSSLDHAQLQGGELDNARLQGASLIDTGFDGASLNAAELMAASLDWSQLPAASMVAAQMQGATLDGAQMSGANLHTANLTGTSLSGTNLRGALLSGAYLKGAWLSGTHFQGARLKNAFFNSTIIIDPDVGNLSMDDAELLPENLELGSKYTEGRSVFLNRIERNERTTWPSKPKLSCMLLLTAHAEIGSPYPDCVLRIEMSGLGSIFVPGTSAPAGVPAPLREFLADFATANAEILCEPNLLTRTNPRRAASALFSALDYLGQEDEVLSIFRDAALPVLMDEQCRDRWPTEVISKQRDLLAAMHPDYDKLGPEEKFLNAWLDALKKVAAEARRAEAASGG